MGSLAKALLAGLVMFCFLAGISADEITRALVPRFTPSLGKCPPMHVPAGIEDHTDLAGDQHRRLVCLGDEKDMHDDPMIIENVETFHQLYGAYIVPKASNLYLFKAGANAPENGGDHVRAIFGGRQKQYEGRHR